MVRDRSDFIWIQNDQMECINLCIKCGNWNKNDGLSSDFGFWKSGAKDFEKYLGQNMQGRSFCRSASGAVVN